MQQTGRLWTLEAGRGIAALMVVLFHSGLSLFRFGHCGVEFFFVLSGFIICYAHDTDIGNPSKLIDYFKKRALRIYPLYWAVLVVLVPLALFGFARTPGKSSFLVIAGSFLLVPMRYTPVLGVAWTLEHEWLFYVLFGLAILHRRLLWIIGFWGASCLLANAPEPNLGAVDGILYPQFPVSFLFSLRNAGFALGMAAAMDAAMRKRLSHPWLFLLAGVATFGGNCIAELIAPLPFRVSITVYLIGAALSIRALVGLESIGAISAPAPLKVLGQASYALYLVHFPIFSVIHKLFEPGSVGALVGISASICVAITIHFLVEAPLGRLAGDFLRVRGPGSAATAAAP